MKSGHNLARIFPLLLAIAFLYGSCERPEVDLPVTGSDNCYHVNGNTYRDIAIAFWEGVNMNYVFWDIEPVSLWDDARAQYLPKISELGTWNPDHPDHEVNNDKFFEYLKGMSRPLHDGHFYLQAEFGDSKNRDFSPAKERVKVRFTDPESTFSKDNCDSEKIINRYLTGVGKWSNGDGFNVASGKIGLSETQYIAYLYFSEFGFTESGSALCLSDFFSLLEDSECTGVIFDVRGNAGGATPDIALLTERLLTEPIIFARGRTKKSEGRLSYAPWIPYIIRPKNPIPNAGKIPVVALINDYSMSCAELLSLAVKAMPNGYLIGTTTFGATGPRIGDDYPNVLNDGGFTVKWGGGSYSIKAVQAGFQTRGKNFENYEGVGIEPDRRVEFNRGKFTRYSKDCQLDAAIRYIKGKL